MSAKVIRRNRPKLLATPALTDRCTRTYCGARLDATRDPMTGRVTVTCAPCSRNARGLCRDCPSPLPGARAFRCVRCASRQRTRMGRAYYERHKDDLLARQKARRRDPEVRAAKCAASKAWHDRNRDDAHRIYMREYMRMWRATPQGRASSRATNRRAVAKNPEKRRQYMRDYYARTREQRLAYMREYHQRRKAQAVAA